VILVERAAGDVELSFTRVPRTKLAETVAQQLLREIRGKQLEPGTRLPSERELMAGLGVGRSSIREAINGLAMLGVLEIRHGQGAFVANPTASTTPPSAIATALARGFTRDLFEARQLVEVHVARLAAERRTEADLREIAQALEDHERAVSEDRLAVEPSVRFHVRIAEAAHSDVLASFVSSLGEVMMQRGPELEAVPGYKQWEIEQHRSVFEPIRDGDPDLAAERMHAHLDAVLPHHERIGIE
jgi:GntR family transcriptional regulator, transcriptional repressor for pyruvate dehydrogenase complex